jgi:rod shape-determining protein MreB
MKANSSKNSAGANAVLEPVQTRSSAEALLVGLDWGTNISSVVTSLRGSTETVTKELIPTVVGYAKDGVLPGVLPDDSKMLFGRMALKHKSNLSLVRPLRGGVIADTEAAGDFARHLGTVLKAGGREVRAVIGMPASSDLASRDNARNAVRGVFDKVIFVPEPFLAALGVRNEANLNDPDYQDPVLNSIYIEIGAGSTDVCLVQGHYPTVDDQLSVPFAGDAVDQIILDKILAEYPESGLTLARVREIKEKHSWVLSEDGMTPAIATIMVGGKPHKIDVTAQVGAGCEALLQKTFEMTSALIARANPDTVSELLGNIIITGGGSLIKGLGVALQAKLIDEGFEAPRVRVLGDNYKDYVAAGALKVARMARDNQWQTLLG